MGLGRLNPGCETCGCEPVEPPCSPCGQPIIQFYAAPPFGPYCRLGVFAGTVPAIQCSGMTLKVYRDGELISEFVDPRGSVLTEVSGNGDYQFVASTECGTTSRTCTLDSSIEDEVRSSTPGCKCIYPPVSYECGTNTIQLRYVFGTPQFEVSGLTGWLAGLNGTYGLGQDQCGFSRVLAEVSDNTGPAPFPYRCGSVRATWNGNEFEAQVGTTHGNYLSSINPKCPRNNLAEGWVPGMYFGSSSKSAAKRRELFPRQVPYRKISCVNECCQVNVNECGAILDLGQSSINSAATYPGTSVDPALFGTPRGSDAIITWLI